MVSHPAQLFTVATQVLQRIGQSLALGLTLLIAVLSLSGQPGNPEAASSALQLASLSAAHPQSVTARPQTLPVTQPPVPLQRHDSLTGAFMTQHRLTGAHLFTDAKAGLVSPVGAAQPMPPQRPANAPTDR